ncbi:MAG TPA: methylenetetrahydrofolate reductase [NAD(P)H] [Thermoleophilaceae bacterium]|nr:methylenetetrahydrofolate reductase [NAD(P)H] [Thermoleophilaceae bacterium]
MRIGEILLHHRPVFSFEFFPPKTDDGQRTLENTLAVLKDDQPDYVSVTYGAGGSTRARTVEITKWIKQDLGIEAMAHLSCVGEPTERLIEILEEVQAAGIENVLALRGDPPRGQTGWTPHPGGLSYSVELIRLIRERFDFTIGAACFPEVHPEARDRPSDLSYARQKVEAGASFLITQLFFENDLYFDFVDAARAAGIHVPIVPGIMPITNVKQIKTITGMCGATIPDELERELDGRADDPEAVAELGVAYATLQCSDLLARGAPGIHFYTLNRSPATRAILAAVRAAHPWTRAKARV